ncbi:MAG TPA: rRNA pseudouridine synthase [Candidatus Atopostipes pullistercoris]|uniref:Pseudouridine synthase n=1 Tax=Candidatus Atopostipes pullistercoris TaxID=2838467 RepID=A0A9D2G111_9LACT|nr:rRNA pseudouridine synthase [Candidatus Atopostipes pullistercoris]
MERLQKVMAHAGVASRRKSEEIIEQGRVKVNGEVVKELGTKVSKNDTITVDDVLIEREQYVYVLLNKPRETISTTDDPKNRDTVVELIADVEERIYPVGRLDWDTTGALLLTNDGELSYKLTHPSFEFPKTYVVKTKGRISKKLGNQLAQGILLDGRKTAPAKVSILSYDRPSDTTVARITLHEGRNHQVKNMFEHIGHPVEKLTRERFGFLSTEGLQSGEWRFLTPHEVKQLEQMVND